MNVSRPAVRSPKNLGSEGSYDCPLWCLCVSHLRMNESPERKTSSTTQVTVQPHTHSHTHTHSRHWDERGDGCKAGFLLRGVMLPPCGQSRDE